MSIEKNIAKALDIEPIEPKEIEIISPEETSVETKEVIVYEDDEDFVFARETLKDLIKKGMLKLDEFGSLASDLETARAFEVYASMLEKMSGLTKDLYDIHKKKKDLKEQDVPSNTVTVEKAVFVGTTTELIDHIKNKNVSSEKKAQ